ncbi:hypothetical protein V6U81_14695 [Micromonospora sp. CPCC 205711]
MWDVPVVAPTPPTTDGAGPPGAEEPEPAPPPPAGRRFLPRSSRSRRI